MKIMTTSFKRSHAHTAALNAPDPVAGHRQPTPPPETPGHSWASLGQSLVGPLLLSPGSWCAQSFVCGLQQSVSPVLCKFWGLYGGGKWQPPSRELMRYSGLLHTDTLALWQATPDLYRCRRLSSTQRQVWLSLCGVSW